MRSIQKCHCSVLCINAQYFLRQINAQFCSVCIYTLDRKVCVGTMRFLVKNTSVPVSKESDHPLHSVSIAWPQQVMRANVATSTCKSSMHTQHVKFSTYVGGGGGGVGLAVSVGVVFVESGVAGLVEEEEED